MAHEDYKEMLVAQALNALEATEMQDLEAHLQSCGECRSQLSEWEDTTAGLAFASLEASPLSPRGSCADAFWKQFEQMRRAGVPKRAARLGWRRVIRPKKPKMDIGSSLRMWCH